MRILPQTNQLATPDARAVDTTFAAELNELDCTTRADLPGLVQIPGGRR